MKWSESKQVWCVKKVQTQSHADVTIWCKEQFGQSQVDGHRDGVWGWAEGNYYGITFDVGGIPVGTRAIYIAFRNQEDALFYILKWGEGDGN